MSMSGSISLYSVDHIMIQHTVTRQDDVSLTHNSIIQRHKMYRQIVEFQYI